MTDSDVLRATGRRKSAPAQVRIMPGSGVVTVNSRKFEDYFPTEPVRGYVMQPLMVTGTEGSFDVKVTVKGGGLIGQAGALRHGLARALIKNDENLRGVLKESGMLTRAQAE